MKAAQLSAVVLCVGALVTMNAEACGFRSSGRISVSRSVKTQTAAAPAAAAGSVVLLGDAGDAGLESALKKANYRVARVADTKSAQETFGNDKNRLIMAPLTEADALRGLGLAVIPVVGAAQVAQAKGKGFNNFVTKESSNDQKVDAIKRSTPGQVAIP